MNERPLDSSHRIRRSKPDERPELDCYAVTHIQIGIAVRHDAESFRQIDEQDRIRPHIMIFVDENGVRSINEPVLATNRVQIVAALSGG